jgi:uncharacterized protein DUF6130
MANLTYMSLKGRALVTAAALVVCASTGLAQSTKESCGPTPVIPLTTQEAPAKLVIDPPLAGPLASRGVAIGPDALAVSPRVGHLHVRVDDASWVWADASGNPIILMGLPPGPHKVLIELEDANHHTLDQGAVSFIVPEKAAIQKQR